MLKLVRKSPLEFGVPVVLLALGVAGWVMAQDFRGDAGTWPGVIMIMMGLGALLVIGAQLLGPRDEANEAAAPVDSSSEDAGAGGLLRIAINVGILVVYIVAVTQLGLYTSTAAYLFVHMLFLGIRPVWLALATSVGVSAVLWIFFGYVLGVSISNTLLF